MSQTQELIRNLVAHAEATPITGEGRQLYRDCKRLATRGSERRRRDFIEECARLFAGHLLAYPHCPLTPEAQRLYERCWMLIGC